MSAASTRCLGRTNMRGNQGIEDGAPAFRAREQVRRIGAPRFHRATRPPGMSMDRSVSGRVQQISDRTSASLTNEGGRTAGPEPAARAPTPQRARARSKSPVPANTRGIRSPRRDPARRWRSGTLAATGRPRRIPGRQCSGRVPESPCDPDGVALAPRSLWVHSPSPSARFQRLWRCAARATCSATAARCKATGLECPPRRRATRIPSPGLQKERRRSLSKPEPAWSDSLRC